MDLTSHPTSEQLERFVLGRSDAGENRAIVLHLLGRCPECQKVMRALWYRTELISTPPPTGVHTPEPGFVVRLQRTGCDDLLPRVRRCAATLGFVGITPSA